MPVINPWVFYWMAVVDDLRLACIIVFFVLASAAVIYPVYCFTAYEDVKVNVEKGICLALAATALVIVLVPSSTTITKMLVAKNVTYERVEAATDAVQSVYEDIMALFEDGGEDG